MKITGAIFDMDGTLTDSMYVWKDIGKRYLIACGITPRETLWQEMKNMSMRQVIDHFVTEYGLNKTADEIREGINALVEPIYREEVLLKKGVADLLQRFSERGIKMCVATATDRHIVEIVLRKNGIEDYFSEIFTCTSVCAGKDTPVIYEKALEHLGTSKEETLVFEDALYALRTAKTAGFPVVGVYDLSSAKDNDMIISLADFYISEYSVDNIF